jgi:hypothetical protein
MQIVSHVAIHSLIICLDSLLTSGTSFTQKIVKLGPWSIFLIVPEVDLYTERVIIWSILIGSLCVFWTRKEKESKALKSDDW